MTHPRFLLGSTATMLGALLVLATGCEGVAAGGAGLSGGRHRGADGGVGDVDGGPMPVGVNIPSREVCGNGMDDDDNGMIDDGCACEAGTSRACYGGGPETRGVGACHDGTQTCDAHGEFPQWGTCDGEGRPSREIIENGIDDDCDGTTDEPDGICIPTGDVGEVAAACSDGRDNDCDSLRDCEDPDCAGDSHCPAACGASETRCFGAVDDDCDGAVDCDDAECLHDAACAPSPCPPGQTPTYRLRDLGASGGASGIMEGPGGARMPMTCEPGPCDPGLVRVETSPGAFACLPPPPACPPGNFPTYTGSGMWRCDPPCDLIVHYGGIYGGLNRCAGHPDVSCDGGNVPTYVLETETWECRPECDNGLYDRIYIGGGELVCVPC